MAQINGTSGNDRREGTLGNDVINLFRGDDLAFGRAGNDIIYGNEGNDDLHGQDGNDRLVGGVGQDELYGGKGNDVLIGGPGADYLTGGEGADRFVYQEIPKDAYGAVENILDFSYAEGDRIDLSAIDARPDIAGDQAFRFVQGNAFTGGRGEVLTLYLDIGDGRKVKSVEIDMDGDRYADMTIGVPGGGDMPPGALIL
ncbi:calcium-binding protein [Sphingomonas sp. Y38-1Y]|uniref:calcium-binding protein n=1 Tax=Sphingomonas sp. Y38-1Y TaxID=3078265 RepID=UPI0028EC6D7A|nr:M10 family metallopeptidase C-terminal domain-containing protein [Sphingomonas sp. Y38-1Y]